MRRRTICILLVIAICASFAGCQKRGAQVASSNLTDDVKLITSSVKRVDKNFKEKYNEYAINMFQNGITENKNSMVSPLSIMMALAMTANGANGETLSQMEKVLAGVKIEDLNQYLTRYSKASHKLSIANSIWIKNGIINVRESFLATNKSYYDADVFASELDSQTIKDINNWVSDKTDGMIKQLLDRFEEDTFMCLINAISFDAKWLVPYADYQVREGQFTNYDGQKVTTDFMYSDEYFYLEGDDYTGYIKQYDDGEYYMVSLLPNVDVNINDFIKGMSSDLLVDIIYNAQTTRVETSMPKFSCDYTIELNDALKNMGINDAFDGDLADFSNMCEIVDEKVSISRVLHKTFIEFNEGGTKAAAATSVEMKCEATAMPPEEPKRVYLDRPFVYAIVDGSTGMPIFIGDYVMAQ